MITYYQKIAKRYRLCSSCFLRKADLAWRFYGESIEPLYEWKRAFKEKIYCNGCDTYITDEPLPWRERRHHYSGHKYKPDTRRISASGKTIGGHHGHPNSWSLGEGKYYKRALHKAWRRYWKRYSQDQSIGADDTRIGSLNHFRSAVAWKNW